MSKEITKKQAKEIARLSAGSLLYQAYIDVPSDETKLSEDSIKKISEEVKNFGEQILSGRESVTSIFDAIDIVLNKE